MAHHVALFGNVPLLRSSCSICGGWALVIDGRLACCDAPFVRTKRPKPVRVTCPEAVRKRPSPHEQQQLLERFRNRCAYCDRQFGDLYELRSKWYRVELCWDHYLPWAYSQNNATVNFLPACTRCNGWKSSKMFETVDEVRQYVAKRWADAQDL